MARRWRGGPGCDGGSPAAGGGGGAMKEPPPPPQEEEDYSSPGVDQQAHGDGGDRGTPAPAAAAAEGTQRGPFAWPGSRILACPALAAHAAETCRIAPFPRLAIHRRR
jgi:hypothetical protein